MRRRDMLKAAAVGLLGAATVKADEEPQGFSADIVLTPYHELGRYVTVYLDGVKQKYCFEALVKWESFDRPTYGRLIMGATRDGHLVPSDLHTPRENEFAHEGVWSYVAKGQVWIELDAAGRGVLAKIREREKEEARQRKARES